MNAGLKVGDKVICVDSKPIDENAGYPTFLEVGEEYTIRHIHACRARFVNVGLILPSLDELYCPHCNENRGRNIYHFSWRFIKIDPGQLKLEEVYEVPLVFPKILEHTLK